MRNQRSDTSTREFRDQIVGKRISAVVARPGRSGQPPVVLMLRFDDGSVIEFVSPRSDRLLREVTRPGGVGETSVDALQLKFEAMQPEMAA